MKSRTFSRRSPFVLVLFLAFTFTAFSSNLCVPKGYTFGFFNGVWNTLAQASSSLSELKKMIGTKFHEETIQYELFYNTTGTSDGATKMQDLAEVFIQRAHEIDESGELEKRWELFWDTLSGKKDFSEKLKELFPKVGDLLDQLYTDIINKSAAGWSYLLSNPPTTADYQKHAIRLKALAIQKQKLMLVAHSQGNLFVNHAYDYVKPLIGEKSVKVVHIAPASPTLRGNYILADIDLVINALRIQGVHSVPAVNIDLPFSMRDPSGHTLVGTYLDPHRDARSVVHNLIDTAMENLEPPTTEGHTGSFTVTLTWNGPGDVDLHTFEPDGTHVYYSARTGHVGYLDVDNTSGYGPEHYYATCDSEQLEDGIYHIGINNYARANGRVATVQLATSKDGVLVTHTLDVGPVRGSSGDSNPIEVFDLKVSKDPDTGKVTFSVQ